MHFATSVLALSALLGFASAHPVEAEIDKRICGSVILPTTQIQLWEDNPDTPYPNTVYTDKSVTLYQDVNFNGAVATVGDKRDVLIGFTGPVGAYGCTLGFTLPDNYIFPSFGGSPSAISVYAVSTPLPASPTYNNIQREYLFGEFDPLKVVGQNVVINSKTCPTAAEGGLAFVLSFADEVTVPAYIGWDEYVNNINGAGLTGVYLSYDC